MPKLILSSENPDDLKFAQGVATACGALLAPIANCDEALAQAGQSEDLTAVFLGLEKASDFAKSPYARDLDRNEVHFLVDRQPSDTHRLIFETDLAGSVVYRQATMIEENAASYAKTLILENDDIELGLDQFFTSAGIQKVELHTSQKKEFAADVVLFRLQKLGCSVRVAQTMANLVDELLLNAIYDAPRDALGNQIFRSVTRDTVVNLDPNKPVTLRIASDDEQIGVSVCDCYGSVARPELFKHFAKAFTRNHAEVSDMSRAGAGLGLSLILKSGASVYVTVEPGFRTEVTLMFKKTQKLTELKSQFQFLATHFGA